MSLTGAGSKSAELKVLRQHHIYLAQIRIRHVTSSADF
jgi:hypothetical protein